MSVVGLARALIPAHPAHISCSFVIALICASYVEVGTSFIVPENNNPHKPTHRVHVQDQVPVPDPRVNPRK